MVAAGHAVDLVLEDLADELGVGAVHHELEALLGEGILELGDLVVERQEALAASALGEAHEKLQLGRRVRLVRADRLLVQRRDLLHLLHRGAGQRRAERAYEHDQHRRDVDERGGRGAFHRGPQKEAQDGGTDSYGGCGFHWEEGSVVPVIGLRGQSYRRRRENQTVACRLRQASSRMPARHSRTSSAISSGGSDTTTFEPVASVITVSGCASTVVIRSGLRCSSSERIPRRCRVIISCPPWRPRERGGGFPHPPPRPIRTSLS